MNQSFFSSFFQKTAGRLPNREGGLFLIGSKLMVRMYFLNLLFFAVAGSGASDTVFATAAVRKNDSEQRWNTGTGHPGH